MKASYGLSSLLITRATELEELHTATDRCDDADAMMATVMRSVRKVTEFSVT
jgi:hypothetical protein